MPMLVAIQFQRVRAQETTPEALWKTVDKCLPAVAESPTIAAVVSANVAALIIGVL
jgi:hypothetical protein